MVVGQVKTQRDRIPWDGPFPSPGDYIAARLPRYALELLAVTPLRRATQWGERLAIEYRTVRRDDLPEAAVVHPWPRAAPTDPTGPERVRQLQESGPTATMRDVWRDPADNNPNARAPREIKGHRAYCALRRMLAQNANCGVTAEHILGADEYRAQVDLANIGWSAPRDEAPVGSVRYGPKDGPSAAASSSARAAAEVARFRKRIPATLHGLLDAVVVRNLSISAWCLKAPPGELRRPQDEKGKLLAILDALAEHYAGEIDKAKRADQVSAA